MTIAKQFGNEFKYITLFGSEFKYKHYLVVNETQQIALFLEKGKPQPLHQLMHTAFIHFIKIQFLQKNASWVTKGRYMDEPSKKGGQHEVGLHQHVILRSKRQLHRLYKSRATTSIRLHPISKA